MDPRPRAAVCLGITRNHLEGIPNLLQWALMLSTDRYLNLLGALYADLANEYLVVNLRVIFTALIIPTISGILFPRGFVHTALLLFLASEFGMFDDFRNWFDS